MRVTFSDIKMPKVPFNGTFTVDLLSKNEYYPYGMKINELSYNNGSTRYGYNGTHEQDREMNADGNYLDFGNFGYDTRVAMRRNQEPLRAKYPHLSGHVILNNNPILYLDPIELDWILANGNQVIWYGGDYGDTSTIVNSYYASSGHKKVQTMEGNFVDLQYNKYQLIVYKL